MIFCKFSIVPKVPVESRARPKIASLCHLAFPEENEIMILEKLKNQYESNQTFTK
jgi:hypothetical protein